MLWAMMQRIKGVLNQAVFEKEFCLNLSSNLNQAWNLSSADFHANDNDYKLENNSAASNLKLLSSEY